MFYIGQDIVCIKSHSCGYVKEGKIYTINGLRKGCCGIEIDVCVPKSPDNIVCFCGKESSANGIAWIHESLFKPLDELSDISELLEVLNKENYQEV